MSTSSLTDLRPIRHLLQGIDARRVGERGLLPIIGPEQGSFFITQSLFGVGKTHSSESPFDDLAKYDPVAFLNDESGSIVFPNVVNNVASNDPYVMDGVIEPLTIRDLAAQTSIFRPFEPHSFKASLQDGNSDILGGANVISQFIEFGEPPLIEPYVDATDTIGTVGAEVFLPGLSPEETRSVTAYNDQSFQKSRDVDTTLDSTISDIVTALSSSDDNFFPRNHRSATAGFVYVGNPEGTDSIAFGGLKRV